MSIANHHKSLIGHFHILKNLHVYGREHRTSYFPCLCHKNWFSKELSPFSGVVVIFRILTISWRPIFVAGFQTFAYQPLSSVNPYLKLHDQTNPAKERLAWFHLWLVMQCDDDRMANGDTGLYRKFVESCMACASEHREPLLEIHRGTKEWPESEKEWDAHIFRLLFVCLIISFQIISYYHSIPALTPGS